MSPAEARRTLAFARSESQLGRSVRGPDLARNLHNLRQAPAGTRTLEGPNPSGPHSRRPNVCQPEGDLGLDYCATWASCTKRDKARAGGCHNDHCFGGRPRKCGPPMGQTRPAHANVVSGRARLGGGRVSVERCQLRNGKRKGQAECGDEWNGSDGSQIKGPQRFGRLDWADCFGIQNQIQSARPPLWLLFWRMRRLVLVGSSLARVAAVDSVAVVIVVVAVAAVVVVVVATTRRRRRRRTRPHDSGQPAETATRTEGASGKRRSLAAPQSGFGT